MTRRPPDGSDHGQPTPPGPAPAGDQGGSSAEWDQRYTEADQVWSGQPNGTLVAEITGRPPGRALDVGCGEGADAVWLAGQGWQVTALDVSAVALGRAALLAEEAGAVVDWRHAGLLEAGLPAASFDLVSAQYPALPRTPEHAVERSLVSLVAPGGMLLVVHHAHHTAEHDRSRGFDPDDYVSPAGVVAQLDEDWDLEVHQTRPRTVTGGAGAHHPEDIVVRARRLR